ncbi:glycoside hydrolase family 5 protein [Magnetospirillum fulvum]|uniref:Endoglucanase n=1 Tax=Magnetospirillum fulvum TaxID=1082 RepID=A0A1H6HEN1_MAGFU|nr:glycoside hydrolase family 5 protein [Magnetospirillum fulvum]SEH32695.1 endoglucanase [Magnetospirillum fulvum]
MRTARYCILRLCIAALLSSCLCVSALAADSAVSQHLTGVNLPNAGFGHKVVPGKHGTNYLWPTPQDVDMYADIGANVLRIAFLWERMQPVLSGPLAKDELERLDALVARGATRHVTILLDVHNYGSFNKIAIGTGNVPSAAFSDLWSRLASHYRNAPNVAFGLMNEPFKHKAAEWAPIAQEAILAIRKSGARQLILVPGTRWSSAYSWLNKDGDLSNGEALANIEDPANNFIFEAHQYFDSNSSGTQPSCVSEDIGVKRLSAFTEWLRQNGKQAFLGEFGASKDPLCLEALSRTLAFLRDNGDVWRGWTYWAAAPWFGDYMFNIYPPDPVRYPQVPVLMGAMRDREKMR